MMFDLVALQKKLLDMFAWFHDFCSKNGLKYYALGGTMLGAIRHHGFIPWDDDIDVGMPRNDYEKFASLLSGKNDRYLLETPYSNDPFFCFAYSKLYDSTTTMIENTNKQLKRGVFIDVFPLDGIGHSEKEGRRNYKKIERLFSLLTLRYLSINKKRSILKNVVIGFVNLIPSCILSEKKLCQTIDKKCKSHPFDDYEWCGNLVGAWGWKEVMPKQILGNPTLYEFEGLRIYGAEHYDTYLSALYGKWRELPPKEKRVTHHDYYVDLSKGYI